MTDKLCFTAGSELARRIRRGELSPVDLANAYLDRIEEQGEDVNAYSALRPREEILDEAKKAEEAVNSGDRLGPLHGVPVALKELLGTKAGLRHTYGCALFEDNVADEDALTTKRLEDAGAIVLGTTSVPEFGHKGTTDNYIQGPTSTPFDHDRNAGGSSGGATAAVGYGLAAIAQGADGGGSLRIPASWSGVVGFKPSFGRVPIRMRPNGFAGHTPYLHQGPQTRNVEDAALMMDVLAGPHSSDPFSLPADEGPSYVASTRESIDGLDVAYSRDFGVFPVEERVESIVTDAAYDLEDAGANVEEVDIEMGHSHQELCELWRRETGVKSAAMAQTFKENGVVDMLEESDKLTPEFTSMLEMGYEMSGVETKQDDAIRTDVYDAIRDVLDEYDLLVTPTTATPPTKNADDGNTLGPTEVNGVDVDPTLGWCLTYPVNFTGNPAVSLPAGFTSNGLPVGIQLIGERFADRTLFAAAGAFERIRPWHDAYDRLH
jgi:Asp-tRNA(Asn)/Glu-tRNA(Gln) amidotransferase A subunit family amidase